MQSTELYKCSRCWMRCCGGLKSVFVCRMVEVVAKQSTLFYLPYNPVPCVYLQACWPQSPRGNGSPDPSPLTPSSAGQTLTPEQMDNGLDALSALDHTLLLPAFTTAAPFTFCCPPSLPLHLSHPSPGWLNSQNHLCFAFFFFLPISIIPFPLRVYRAHLFNHIIFSMHPSSFRCSYDLSALYRV